MVPFAPTPTPPLAPGKPRLLMFGALLDDACHSIKYSIMNLPCTTRKLLIIIPAFTGCALNGTHPANQASSFSAN
jgi:hypothetical protein